MSENEGLEPTKRFINQHFERLLVVFLMATLLLIQYFIEYKFAFLSFYYLPIIAAGFLVGRKMAVAASVFVVLLVFFFQGFMGLDGNSGFNAEDLLTLIPWGGFLILTGYIVGTLAEQRRMKTDDVRSTYLTMLELLTLHVDSSDRMRRGHSYRVGERAVTLAKSLGLNESQQEDLRVAGLLHEIGPRDPRLVRVMSDLPASRETGMTSMRGALRLVDEYSHYHEIVSTGASVDEAKISIGAKVLAVADAYETLQTPSPTRQAFAPWSALEEIARGAGKTFATEVVQALRASSQLERAEGATGEHSVPPAIRLA